MIYVFYGFLAWSIGFIIGIVLYELAQPRPCFGGGGRIRSSEVERIKKEIMAHSPQCNKQKVEVNQEE